MNEKLEIFINKFFGAFKWNNKMNLTFNRSRLFNTYEIVRIILNSSLK